VSPRYWELNAENWSDADLFEYGRFFVHGLNPQPPTPRKLRLFVAGCYRLIWDRIPSGAYRGAVEAGEAFADGGPIEAAWAARDAAVELAAGDFTAIPADPLEEGGLYPAWRQFVEALERVSAPISPLARTGDEARALHLAVFRDVFGNPFRPVAFDPAWRTEAVVTLARGMYEGRDFAAMPVLADALDDAGCDHPDILAHCRGPGPHVRGCWVADLVLGKA
jgi:hypothetical protein